MTLRHLRVFLSVCQHRSMTGAAQELFLTQPAVSQTIRELEEYYSTSLFDRFPRRLELTKSGELLRETANNILFSLNEVETRIRFEELVGRLRIGANLSAGTVLVHPVLQEFQKNHPDTRIELLVTRASVLEEKLNENELDFCLMELSGRENDFVAEPFYEDRIVLVGRPDSPYAARENLRLRDMEKESFLLREKGAGVRDQFDHLVLAHKLEIHPAWESSSTTCLVNGVFAGFGIAVLPYLLVKKYLDAGTLSELPVQDAKLGRVLNIVHHKNKLLTRPAQDFIQVVRNRYGMA